jgi:predicted  nucleic acid-binding Zn-ribbon protein
MVNFCSNCGKKLNKSDKFCPNCGKRIIKDSESMDDYETQKNLEKTNNSNNIDSAEMNNDLSKNNIKKQDEEKVDPENIVSTDNYLNYNPNPNKNKDKTVGNTKDRKTKVILIVAAIIACVVIAGMAFYAYNTFANPTPSSSGSSTSSSSGVDGFLNTATGSDYLEIQDIKIDMSGYDYNLTYNSTDNYDGMKSYYYSYDVIGNGDSFTLTVSIIEDDLYDDYSENSTTVSGGNSKSVTKVITVNGKEYSISIDGANSEHSTKNYLDSLVSIK